MHIDRAEKDKGKEIKDKNVGTHDIEAPYHRCVCVCWRGGKGGSELKVLECTDVWQLTRAL